MARTSRIEQPPATSASENYGRRPGPSKTEMTARTVASEDFVLPAQKSRRRAGQQDSQNPTKLRVQRRARQIGKTLGQVYKEAGVNKQYLSDMPEGGWPLDKRRRIAAALQWTVAELDQEDDTEAAMPRAFDNTMGWAIEFAHHLLAMTGKVPPRRHAELSLRLYHMIMGLSHGKTPNEQQVIFLARQFSTALDPDFPHSHEEE